MDCKRCGTQLNHAEIINLRDRCVTCYRKGVKFILGQKSAEIEELTRKHKELNDEIDRLTRSLDVTTREWKKELGNVHILKSAITNVPTTT